MSIGLRLFRDYDATSWHWLMAASVVTMLPCLVVFFFAQKLFVQGIATTGHQGLTHPENASSGAQDKNVYWRGSRR